MSLTLIFIHAGYHFRKQGEKIPWLTDVEYTEYAGKKINGEIINSPST